MVNCVKGPKGLSKQATTYMTKC